MQPILIGAPGVEPVSLDDAKAWLREDGDDEDQLIQALAVSARITLEAYTRRFFVTQSWRLVMDAWPDSVASDNTLLIPFAPLQSVDAIRVYDAGDVAHPLDPASYRAPSASDWGRVIFTSPPPAPGRRADGVEIDITIGYGSLPSQTPEPLRRAILTLTAFWRETRGDAPSDLPKSVGQLAGPFRRQRLI